MLCIICTLMIIEIPKLKEIEISQYVIDFELVKK